MPLLEDFIPAFDDRVYERRLAAVTELMFDRGMDALLVSNPSNVVYLSGFESESWFTTILLVVLPNAPEPIFVAREIDDRAARLTTWLSEDYIRCYPDEYAGGAGPATWIAELIRDRVGDVETVGVELRSNHLPPVVYDGVRRALPTVVDASLMVNELYRVKSPEELEYIERAGDITDRAMEEAASVISAGVRECDAMAEILRTLVRGTEEWGGGLPAMAPMFGPYHYTFSDRQFEPGDLFSIELSATVRNYYKPISRPVHVGEPTAEVRAMFADLSENLALLLELIEPGRTCESVCESFRREANDPNSKAGHFGHVVGFGLTTWAEGSAKIAPGQTTVLEPNMVLQPNLSIEDIGERGTRMLLGETCRVTERGCDVIGSFPRELIVV